MTDTSGKLLDRRMMEKRKGETVAELMVAKEDVMVIVDDFLFLQYAKMLAGHLQSAYLW